MCSLKIMNFDSKFKSTITLSDLLNSKVLNLW